MSNNPEIDAAIHLLTEAGYTVTPPPCPECKGNGWVYVARPVPPTAGGFTAGPCPRKCERSKTLPVANGPLDGPTGFIGHGCPSGAIPTDARARSTRTHDL